MLSSVPATALAALLPAFAHAIPFGSPNVPRQIIDGQYPPARTSPGFTLVVNVTDPSNDLPEPVHGMHVNLFRVASGQNAASVSADPGYVFWHNNTRFDGSDPVASPDLPAYQGTLNANSAGERALGFAGPSTNPNFREITINEGGGDPDWKIARPGWPFAELQQGMPRQTEGTLVVCQGSGAPNLPKLRLAIVQATYADPIGVEERIPEGCVAVNVLSECAELLPPPPGATYNHDFVIESRCYPSVAAIDWSQWPEPKPKF